MLPSTCLSRVAMQTGGSRTEIVANVRQLSKFLNRQVTHVHIFERAQLVVNILRHPTHVDLEFSDSLGT